MNMHENARLTPSGRALLAARVESGWGVGTAAEAAGVSARTVYKWPERHRSGDERRHHDRSSAPSRCPHATPACRVAQIEAMRRQRMTGPRIAAALAVPPSTMGAVLRRLGLGRLSALDLNPQVIRYEREMPGELLHIASRAWAESTASATASPASTLAVIARGIGYDHLHVCIDDASRLAYVEVLPSLGQEDATGFLEHALA